MADLAVDEVRTTAVGDVTEILFHARFLTAELARGLGAAFNAVDPASTRAVVLAGTGTAFAAGADIGPLRTGETDDGIRFNRLLIDLSDQVSGCPVPVICCLNGMAFGGGLELALASTMRLARADALLGFPEVKVGIIPGSGGLLRLSHAVRPAVAADLVLTGRTFDGAEAKALGLVDETTEGDPLPRGHQIAAAMAAAAPLAVRAALDVLRRASALSHQDGIRLVEDHLRGLLPTRDASEGFAAFAEHRRPHFTGS